MNSAFAVSIIRFHSRSILKSTNGFILLPVLVFFMLFSSTITVLLIDKNMSVQQNIFFKMAKVRVETEREIISVIRNHEVFPTEEELNIEGQNVLITYGDTIKALICGEFCYVMLIEFDQRSLLILSIDYE